MNYEIDYCKKYEPVFGSWYIKRKLGEGNFGAVFEIEREDFGTKYHAALKVISIPKNKAELESIMNDTLDDGATEKYIRTVVEKIIKEFELMAKLKGNSNIVSYEDHVVLKHTEDAGWDILIRMELLTPMLKYVKTRVITRRDVIKVGIDICRALELCEKHNIIHRDIKPENIFVSESGDYKLGDFGIAKQVEESQTELTKIGTPTYMAPEVVKGHEYDTSVDMYSLGVVLYRFLNHNRAPFMPQYPKPVDFSYKDMAFGERINGAKPFPMPTNAGSEELANVIIKACSYRPEDRFSSPSDMRRALEDVLLNMSDELLSVPAMSYAPEGESTPSKSKEAPALPEQEEKEEKTELLESQNKYVVKAKESMILDNVTAGAVTLSRVDETKISVEITRNDGVKEKHDAWTGTKVNLKPGEKMLINNTSDKNVVFYVSFGVVLSPEEDKKIPLRKNKEKKKSKVLPIILVILLVAVVATAAYVFVGKDLFAKQPNDKQVGAEVIEETEIELDNESIKPQNKPENKPQNKPEDKKEEKIDYSISNIPESIDLNPDEECVLEPEILPENKDNKSASFKSLNENVAIVDKNGKISAKGEGKTKIVVTFENAKAETQVVVLDRNAKIEKINAILNDALVVCDEVESMTNKDTSSLKDKISEIRAFVEEYIHIDLTLHENFSLDNICSSLETVLLPMVEELKGKVAELPEIAKCSYCGSTSHVNHPKCSYCGSLNHTTHPKCSVCGSLDHTQHPKCNICGSYDHTSHPKCSYCGSYDHTTHPKCNICGSLEHAVHPAITPDL